jgi:tRNA:m4X modification enzyme
MSRCAFYLEKKKRSCPLIPVQGYTFCSQHLQHPDRTPCPLDPHHSVWKKDLEKHLLICNSKPLNVNWIKTNSNLLPPMDISKTEKEIDLDVFIPKILKIYHSIPQEQMKIPFACLDHPLLHSRISETTHPKHALQLASLIGHLEINPNATYIGKKNFIIYFRMGRRKSRMVVVCLQRNAGIWTFHLN